MDELFQGFLLGSAAIVTNACLLPLYPGLIAFLSGDATSGDSSKRGFSRTAILGVLVLAGVLTMMIAIGAGLFFLSASFGDILPILLPLIYAIVIIFGLMMLSGRNIFAKMQTFQAPVVSNRYVTAYLYGLLFGPMTLPCTGPIITTAFFLGTTEGGSLIGELLYFTAFGIGFGWPLLVLPLVAYPLQRLVVGWLAKNHDVLERASGILLIAVGIFGILTELIPQIATDFEVSQTAQLLYWAGVLLITAAVGWWTYQHINQPKIKHEPREA